MPVLRGKGYCQKSVSKIFQEIVKNRSVALLVYMQALLQSADIAENVKIYGLLYPKPHKSANFSLTNLFLCATIIIQTNGAVKVSTGIVNPAKHAEIALSL